MPDFFEIARDISKAVSHIPGELCPRVRRLRTAPLLSEITALADEIWGPGSASTVMHNSGLDELFTFTTKTKGEELLDRAMDQSRWHTTDPSVSGMAEKISALAKAAFHPSGGLAHFATSTEQERAILRRQAGTPLPPFLPPIDENSYVITAEMRQSLRAGDPKYKTHYMAFHAGHTAWSLDQIALSNLHPAYSSDMIDALDHIGAMEKALHMDPYRLLRERDPLEFPFQQAEGLRLRIRMDDFGTSIRSHKDLSSRFEYLLGRGGTVSFRHGPILKQAAMVDESGDTKGLLTELDGFVHVWEPVSPPGAKKHAFTIIDPVMGPVFGHTNTMNRPDLQSVIANVCGHGSIASQFTGKIM